MAFLTTTVATLINKSETKAPTEDLLKLHATLRLTNDCRRRGGEEGGMEILWRRQLKIVAAGVVVAVVAVVVVVAIAALAVQVAVEVIATALEGVVIAVEIGCRTVGGGGRRGGGCGGKAK